MHDQIDIVCAVGLAADMLDFFRTVPVKIVTEEINGPGRYTRQKTVELPLDIVAFRRRPVLLHEFLHAYHGQKVKDGVRNEDIRTYYQRAKQNEFYAAKSHMMSNVNEFFACSATTYLTGATGQEPFQREKLRTNQPQFFEHLKRMFGPEAGAYQMAIAPPDQKRLQQLKREKRQPPAVVAPAADAAAAKE